MGCRARGERKRKRGRDGLERCSAQGGIRGGGGGGGRGGGGKAQRHARRQVTDGVCFSQPCTCAGGSVSWVLHKGAMGLLGTDTASRTHKLSWNYPRTEKYGHSSIAYSGQAHYTILTPETEERRGEGGVKTERERERGGRLAHGRRKCRLILLHILPQLKLHLSKSVDFSLI